jgi:hypothetical protein
VATLVVDNPQAATVLLIAEVQAVPVRNVGEGHRSGGDDDHEACRDDDTKPGDSGVSPEKNSAVSDPPPAQPLTNYGAVSKGHSRSFAQSPSPPPVLPGRLGFLRPRLA